MYVFLFVSIVAPVFIILKVSLVLCPSSVPCEVVAQEDLVGVLPIAPLSSDAFEVPHELAIDVEGDALFTLSFVFSLSVFFFVWVCKKNFFFEVFIKYPRCGTTHCCTRASSARR